MPSTVPSGTCRKCSAFSLGLFNNCDPESIDKLFKDRELRAFRQGDIIAREGERFTGLYCLQQGTVKTVKKLKDRQDTILWFAQPGDLIGLHSFANHRSYIYTSIAMEDTQACFIPVKDLDRFVEREKSFSMTLIKALSQRITLIEERLTSIAQKPTGKRVAEMLLSLCPSENLSQDRYGKITAEARLFDVGDLASFIGTTRNYMAKLLHGFSSRGIIEIHKGKIRIKDLNKLVLLSNGNLRN